VNKIKWWQWILIIIVVGMIYYLVSPKYYFAMNGSIRCNKITGKVERSFKHSSDLPIRLIK